VRGQRAAVGTRLLHGPFNRGIMQWTSRMRGCGPGGCQAACSSGACLHESLRPPINPLSSNSSARGRARHIFGGCHRLCKEGWGSGGSVGTRPLHGRHNRGPLAPRLCRLFAALPPHLFLAFTSNQSPGNLYRKGHNRQAFQPFVDLLTR